jgi:hypothetical protein
MVVSGGSSKISGSQLERGGQAHCAQEGCRAAIALALSFPPRNRGLVAADFFRELLLRQACTLAGFAQDSRDRFRVTGAHSRSL